MRRHGKALLWFENRICYDFTMKTHSYYNQGVEVLKYMNTLYRFTRGPSPTAPGRVHLQPPASYQPFAFACVVKVSNNSQVAYCKHRMCRLEYFGLKNDPFYVLSFCRQAQIRVRRRPCPPKQKDGEVAHLRRRKTYLSYMYSKCTTNIKTITVEDSKTMQHLHP